MDVNSQNKDETKSSRSKRFALAGYILSGFFIASFIFLVINAFIQLDFWKTYFYKDSYHLTDSCVAATSVGPEKDLTPSHFKFAEKKSLKIPHKSLLEFEREPMTWEYKHVYYLCQIPAKDITPEKGLSYFHVSWLFGMHSRVYINDQLKASFTDIDKPSIPILAEDLAAETLKIEIISAGEANAERVGLQGAAPTVIATDQSLNFKIFGIETALQSVRYLINVLPLLTLALVLTFGWLLGIRSRLVLSVFIYFAFAVTRNFLVLYSDVWPWDYGHSYFYSASCAIGTTIALVVFAFEFVHFAGRFLSLIMRLTFFLVPAICVAYSFVEKPLQFTEHIRTAMLVITLIGASAVIAVSFVKLRNEEIETYLRSPTKWLMGLFALLGIATLVDQLQLFGPVLLSLKIDVIMPFVIGGFLFYVLKLIQDRYAEEREKRHKMETDLEIAKEIQDSLGPPPPETKFGEYTLSCYQIKHSQVAGDWMAVRENGQDELLVVIADVTGKGIQAALVVHAIQSMWADALSEDIIAPDEWLKRLNNTLYTLGAQKPHSATVGLLRLRKGCVDYFCMGHIPTFIVDKEKNEVHALLSRGAITGISEEVHVESKRFDLSEMGHFHILLGTDGVFDKGSRTKPREVLSFLEALLADGKDSLIDRDDGDDRTLFHIHSGV